MPGSVNALCYSSQSMTFTTGSEYTENTYVHLKLIFAFAAQSSLSKVRNNNVQNAVCTCDPCARAAPTRHAASYPCHKHKPVLGTRYSGTVSQSCTLRAGTYR